MNPGTRLSDRTKAAIAILVTLALIAMLFVAAEVAVRVRQYIKYGHGVSFESLYEIDSKIRLRIPRANADQGRIRINSLGYRSPEIESAKPAGAVRFAFLGASTTFSAEASSNEAVWPHLVVDALRQQHPERLIDFVNGGVPGYTVNSSLRNLEHRVSKLKPDVIVIYHATNDLSGELRDLAAASGLVQNVSPPETSWLSRYSLLWNLVNKNLIVLAAQHNRDSGDTPTIKFDPGSLGSEFRADLTRLVRAAKATGATVALVTFSMHLRENMSKSASDRAMESAVLYMPGFDFSGLLSAFRRYNEVIHEVAEAEGTVLIGGEDSIPGAPSHFVDSVHFTDEGNRAQAERVFKVLSQAEPVRQRFEIR